MIKFWGVEEVGNWLESLGLGEYKEQFAKHDVRGPELLNLERSDLKVCQVTRWNEMVNTGGGSRGSGRGGGSWTLTCEKCVLMRAPVRVIMISGRVYTFFSFHVTPPWRMWNLFESTNTKTKCPIGTTQVFSDLQLPGVILE